MFAGIIIGGRRISISFEDLTTPPFELSTSSSSHFANHGADKPSSSQNSRSRASIQSTDEFGRQRRAPSNESHSADDERELSPWFVLSFSCLLSRSTTLNIVPLFVSSRRCAVDCEGKWFWGFLLCVERRRGLMSRSEGDFLLLRFACFFTA